jgi:hypothetical protein
MRLLKVVVVSLLVAVGLFGQAQGIQTAQMITTPPSGVINASYAITGTAGNTTPIVSVAVPTASLASAAFVSETTANNTLTTFGWQGAMTSGTAIQLIKTGANACTTITSMNYKVTYQVSY